MSRLNSRIQKLEKVEGRVRLEVLKAGMSEAEKDDFIWNYESTFGPSTCVTFIDTGVPRLEDEGRTL